MARPILQWQYGYTEIGELMNLSQDAIRKTASRGGFNPSDLRSIMLYAAANANDEFKTELIHALMRVGKFNVPKPPKKGNHDSK